MELFRISTKEYSNQLTASGSPNRWNKRGEFVMYTSGSRSLSTLELVVHRNVIKPKFPYKVLVISLVDNDNLIHSIKSKDLPKKSNTMQAYAQLQEIGSHWYHNKTSLVLKIPSAIIQQEHNYIINTKHPDFEKNIKLVHTEKYFWDERLL
jgi:RES domain-containing protein